MGFRIVEGPLSEKSSSVTAATNFTSTKQCIVRARGRTPNRTLENMEDMNISYLFGGCIAYLLFLCLLPAKIAAINGFVPGGRPG